MNNSNSNIDYIIIWLISHVPFNYINCHLHRKIIVAKVNVLLFSSSCRQSLQHFKVIIPHL